MNYPIGKWFWFRRWDECRIKPMTYYIGLIKIPNENDRDKTGCVKYKGRIFALTIPIRIKVEFGNKFPIKIEKK